MVRGRVLVGLAVMGCGGSASTAPPATQAEQQTAARDAILQMAEFRDDMCACTDKPCVDQVTERMRIWGRMMASRGEAPQRSPEEKAELAQITEALGKCIAAASPAPPHAPELVFAPADAAPITVSPDELESHRAAGNALIVPDDDTVDAFARSGRTRLITTIKLCTAADGSVSKTQLLKSSGFASYDAKLLREIAEWKYRPLVVDGVAQNACTVTTLLYSQQPAAATPP